MPTANKKYRDKLLAFGIDKAILIQAIDHDGICPKLLCDRLQIIMVAHLKKLPIQLWQLQLLSGKLHFFQALSDTDLVATDVNGASSVHYAAWSGNPGALAWYEKEHPAFMDLRDKHNSSIIHYAGISGSVPLLDWLHENYPTRMGEADNMLQTFANNVVASGKVPALQWAQDNYPEHMNKLMDFSRYSDDMYYIDTIAAYSGNHEALDWVTDHPLYRRAWQITLQIEMKRHARVESFTVRSVGINAALSGNVACLQWLKDYNSLYLDDIDNQHRNIAHYVTRSGDVDALQWFKDNFADEMTMLDSQGRSIAYPAVESNNPNALTWVQDNYPEMIDDDLILFALSCNDFYGRTLRREILNKALLMLKQPTQLNLSKISANSRQRAMSINHVTTVVPSTPLHECLTAVNNALTINWLISEIILPDGFVPSPETKALIEDINCKATHNKNLAGFIALRQGFWQTNDKNLTQQLPEEIFDYQILPWLVPQEKLQIGLEYVKRRLSPDIRAIGRTVRELEASNSWKFLGFTYRGYPKAEAKKLIEQAPQLVRDAMQETNSENYPENFAAFNTRARCVLKL